PSTSTTEERAVCDSVRGLSGDRRSRGVDELMVEDADGAIQIGARHEPGDPERGGRDAADLDPLSAQRVGAATDLAIAGVDPRTDCAHRPEAVHECRPAVEVLAEPLFVVQ